TAELAARIETLAEECEAQRTAQATAAAERDRLAAQAEETAAARAHELEEARVREAERAQQLAALRLEVETLQTEQTRLATVTSEQAELREAYAAIELERDGLRAEVEGTTAARTRLEQSLEQTLEEARTRTTDAAQQLAELQREATTLRSARDGSEA